MVFTHVPNFWIEGASRIAAILDNFFASCASVKTRRRGYGICDGGQPEVALFAIGIQMVVLYLVVRLASVDHPLPADNKRDGAKSHRPSLSSSSQDLRGAVVPAGRVDDSE